MLGSHRGDLRCERLSHCAGFIASRLLLTRAQFEANADLQRRSAVALASFIDHCTSPDSRLTANPSDKLVKNVCAFLCQDVTETPLFASSKSRAGTLVAPGSEAAVAPSDKTRLIGRGAQAALAALSERFADDLLGRLPQLRISMLDPLTTTFADGPERADEQIGAKDEVGQAVLDSLSVLAAVVPHLSERVGADVVPVFSCLASALRSRYAVVRSSAARSFARICDAMPLQGLGAVVDGVLPFMGDPLHPDHRRGAVGLVTRASDRVESS